ncbi:MAG: SRPBCC family protein [Candidatus Eremiobacteraeota bacterium]|nr:SRPBCC family protein [Candidatus Eremiobacteraeota bacterium]MBV8370987.1 SRPBCC family protein [Candidatus Eremiobacteraeota bacterium]
MAEHSGSVSVNAPVHQVYELYSHFNDYPKFMTFVKEVTYLDEERSHWVVDVVGKHEWDAVNEDWIADRQIGWRSLDGLENSGRVTFEPDGGARTRITVQVSYTPPAGIAGALAERLGAGGQFERRLQHDLQHFAAMVEQAPPGALDPTSSAYLFHAESAAAKGQTTQAQNESMGMSGDDAAPGNRGSIESTTEIASNDVRSAPVGTNVSPADAELNDPAIPRIPGTSANPDQPI